MGIGTKIGVVVGGAVAVAMMVAALWGWQQGPRLAEEALHPPRVLWAVRSAAIGAAALAQLVILTFVVGGVYHHGRNLTGERLRLSAAVVIAVALVGAAVVGFGGQ